MSKHIPTVIIIAILCELKPVEGNNFFQEDLEDWEEVMSLFRKFIGNRKSVSYSELQKFVRNYDVTVYQFGGPSVDVGVLLMNKLYSFKE